MSLDLPVLGETGPGWGTKINNAFLNLDGRIVQIREQWLDPTDPLFGGFFDNVSRPLGSLYASQAAAQAALPTYSLGADWASVEADTAALQGCLNYMGDYSAHRCGRIYIPGWGVINRLLFQNHRSVTWQGKGREGIAGGSAVAAGSGLRVGADFPTGQALLHMQGSYGSIVSGLRFLQSTSASNQPTAFIQEHYVSATDSPPNTMIKYEDLWFGRFNGRGSAETSTVYPNLANTWGILLTGDADAQNDQSSVDRCMFFGIGQALRNNVSPGAQQVLWWFRDCSFYFLQQVANVSAQIRLSNCYTAESAVRDFDIVQGGVVVLETFHSELSKQLARMRGTSKVTIRDFSSFLVTNNLLQGTNFAGGAQGLIIDAVDDNRQSVELDSLVISEQPGYSGANPVIMVKGANLGPTSHKYLKIEGVTYGGAPFDESHLDCQLTSNLQQITVEGSTEGTPDGSGSGSRRRFFNDLRTVGALPDFNRIDQTVTYVPAVTRLSLGGVNGALAWTLDRVQAIFLNANATSATIPSGAYDGQLVTLSLTQDGSTRTYAWPAACHFAGGAAPTPSAGGFRTDSVTFRWDSVLSWWIEVSRAVGAV